MSWMQQNNKWNNEQRREDAWDKKTRLLIDVEIGLKKQIVVKNKEKQIQGYKLPGCICSPMIRIAMY